MFDLISFVVGLLVGMIIMLLIIWILYATRSFLFTYCPTQARVCGGADYYSDPSDALANDSKLTVGEILFLNDNNEMFYRRVPKSTDCVPAANDLVYMKYPQYCTFTNINGNTGTYKETAFNSNLYKLVGDSTAQPFTTEGNCDPTPQQSIISGNPQLKWDPNPIS